MQEKCEPKNRPVSTDLGVIDIEITCGNQREIYDPNGLIFAIISGKLKNLPPLQGVVSDISGAPAILYRSNEVQLALTPAEFERLTMRSLTAQEFSALLEKFGKFFEIHEDFYDLETGLALQPKN